MSIPYLAPVMAFPVTSRKIRRSEGLIARRAIRRATQHRTCWRQRGPQVLAFCPSDLPVKITKVLGTSQQQASSPKRSLGSALRRHGSFCKQAAARQPRMMRLRAALALQDGGA